MKGTATGHVFVWLLSGKSELVQFTAMPVNLSSGRICFSRGFVIVYPAVCPNMDVVFKDSRPLWLRVAHRTGRFPAPVCQCTRGLQ